MYFHPLQEEIGNLSDEEISKRIKDLGLENDLINHEGLTPGMLVTLGEQKVLSLIDLADLASCLLYTSPSPRDLSTSRMPSSA